MKPGAAPDGSDLIIDEPLGGGEGDVEVAERVVAIGGLPQRSSMLAYQ